MKSLARIYTSYPLKTSERTTTITLNDNRRLDLTQSVSNDWGCFKDRLSAKSNKIKSILLVQNPVTSHIQYTNTIILRAMYNLQMSRLITKPTKCLCAQRRLRSARWASAQSDQSLRCPHEESLGLQLPIKRTAKTLIRLGGCPG